jgi:hypothetical protein
MEWALVAVRALDSLEPRLGVESLGLLPGISQIPAIYSEQLELDVKMYVPLTYT